MQGQSYFQLISPLIFLVFSCGFAVLWHYARDIVALRVFAISYFLGACGLMGDFLRPLMAPDVAVFLINPIYVATAVFFAAALFLFYRRHVPWRVLAGISLAILAALTWFRLGVDSITARTLVMNTGGFVLFAYPAYALRREMMRTVDRVLQALVFLNGLQLILRTLVVIWYEGATLTSANYADSVAAMTFQLSVSFAALAIAVNLFVMFGMEIVSGITETSHTDPLTGVLNRRGFDARIGEFLGAASTGAGSHAVIVADIDRFKAINDRFGHGAGDKVIARLARLLACTARDADLVARWGGEEFLIVIANGDAALARLYAEAVRAAFENMSHDCLDGAHATASFGVATWRGDQPVTDAAHFADSALYHAKRTGRNRVCVEGPEIAAGVSRPATA